MYRILAVAISLTLLPSLSSAADSAAPFGKVVPGKKGPASVAELFVSSENLQTVRDPEKVVACLLRYVERSKDDTSKEERYEEVQAVVVNEDLSAKMQLALMSESTYAWSSSKFCSPRYNARLQFHRRENIVAVDFCFGCRTLRLVRNGRTFNYEDFNDPIFLQSMRQIFPNDSVLKKVQ